MGRKWMVRSAAVVLAVLGTGCAGSKVSSAPTGRDTARQAVTAFLEGAKAGDLDAMALVWGGEKGASTVTMRRDDREKRLLIVRCHLQHDTSRIETEYPADKGRRAFRVALTFRGLTRTTTMQAVPGPGERWYLESVDIEKTADFCRMGGVGTGG